MIIDHHVKKATNLDDFRHSSGPRKGMRIFRMPYWIKFEDAWVFDFIHEHTDVERLKHNIESGSVYILDKIQTRK